MPYVIDKSKRLFFKKNEESLKFLVFGYKKTEINLEQHMCWWMCFWDSWFTEEFAVFISEDVYFNDFVNIFLRDSRNNISKVPITFELITEVPNEQEWTEILVRKPKPIHSL